MQHLINPKTNRSGGGCFTALCHTSAILKYKPHFVPAIDPVKPKRKNLQAPDDNNTFVKPLRQCFVKNPRLMPMTRIMLTLLAGWAGQGTAIETTTGIIGKHLSRCRRQVFRYLKDAVEEGYLSYTRTKDRIGRYTGIKIWLNFAAINFKASKNRKKHYKEKKQNIAVQDAEKLDVTLKSETNTNSILNNKEKEKDDQLWNKLAQLACTMGYIKEAKPPI